LISWFPGAPYWSASNFVLIVDPWECTLPLPLLAHLDTDEDNLERRRRVLLDMAQRFEARARRAIPWGGCIEPW
jgi:hypothetical protein